MGLESGQWCANLKWHEFVGHGLLAWKDGALHRLLEQHEEGSSERIRDLLLGEYYFAYLPRLLVGDVDVDRADFVRRDTFQTGVGYGRYDLEWLISTCSIGLTVSDQHKEWVVGFDARKAIRVVEQFLIARRALYETVYYHKTVRCAEGMMALFLRRLKVVIRDGTKLLDSRIFAPLIDVINGKAVGQRDLLSLDDSIIHLAIEMVALSDVKDETVRDLARRVRERDLFKMVPVSEQALDKFITDGNWQKKLCETIKPYARGDSEYYFHLDTRRFRVMSKKPREKVFLTKPNRDAEPAMDHPAFAPYRDEEDHLKSIYTVHEAVDAVRKLVEQA